MSVLPPTVVGLIAYLENQFPSRPPSLKDNDREVWFKAGQRSVVEHLLWLRDNDEDQYDVFLRKQQEPNTG